MISCLDAVSVYMSGHLSASNRASTTARGSDRHLEASWTRLEGLSLDSNRLTALPGNLAALRALTRLDVSQQQGNECQLSEPLDFLQSMPALQKLFLLQDEDGSLVTHARHEWNATSLCYLMEAEQMIATLSTSVDMVFFQSMAQSGTTKMHTG